MKLKEERAGLRKLGLAVLRGRLVDAKQELFNLRFQLATGHLQDVSRVGQVKKQIAIGSGGLKGKGFMNGTQTKLKYVPEQDTDFIFCTVGEEQGFP